MARTMSWDIAESRPNHPIVASLSVAQNTYKLLPPPKKKEIVTFYHVLRRWYLERRLFIHSLLQIKLPSSFSDAYKWEKNLSIYWILCSKHKMLEWIISFTHRKILWFNKFKKCVYLYRCILVYLYVYSYIGTYTDIHSS